MKQMIGDPSGPPIFKWHFEKIKLFLMYSHQSVMRLFKNTS